MIDGNGGVYAGLVVTEPVGKAPICQSLMDLSLDTEMRVDGEENTRERMISVCPARISTRREFGLVISQTYIVPPTAAAISLPSGEKQK